MRSVCDTGGNTRVVSSTASWMVHYFLNFFQKLAGNEYCSEPCQASKCNVFLMNPGIYMMNYFIQKPL